MAKNDRFWYTGALRALMSPSKTGNEGSKQGDLVHPRLGIHHKKYQIFRQKNRANLDFFQLSSL